MCSGAAINLNFNRSTRRILFIQVTNTHFNPAASIIHSVHVSGAKPWENETYTLCLVALYKSGSAFTVIYHETFVFRVFLWGNLAELLNNLPKLNYTYYIAGEFSSSQFSLAFSYFIIFFKLLNFVLVIITRIYVNVVRLLCFDH